MHLKLLQNVSLKKLIKANKLQTKRQVGTVKILDYFSSPNLSRPNINSKHVKTNINVNCHNTLQQTSY